jgi:DNA polymerase-3 subunit alpha
MPQPELDVDEKPWPDRRRLSFEKETLGFYLTGHPLAEHSKTMRKLASHTTGSLRNGGDGPVAIGGLVTRIRQNKIKSGPNAGRLMGRFVLEDEEGTVPVAVFADTLQKYASILEEEAIVLIKGTARDRGSGVELTVEEMTPLDQAEDRLVTELRLTLPTEMTTTDLMTLRDLLIENAGEVPVRLHLELENGEVQIAPDERFKVRYDPGLVTSIEALLGPGSVTKLMGLQSVAIA